MKIHEYQSRQILADARIPVPPGEVVESVEQAVAAYRRIQRASPQGSGRVVVKAQTFAGGRGKAGFVKLCDGEAQVAQAARFMLSNRMVSKQTGPAGVTVRKLLLASAVDIDHEYYVGLVVDRARSCPVMMVSRQGGVEIEETAARDPQAIVKQWLHPHLGLQPFQATRLAYELGFTQKEPLGAVSQILLKLAEVFGRCDASLAEINPLVRTKDGQILAIDAKMTLDDNALFRHPELAEMRDLSEENPNELRAKEHDLSYIALDGNIGCLVNGAGLAMATMDIIKLYGGEPANFLDVGGSVTREGATEAFRIILADPKVRGVLVNIFGGIAKCDTIAAALIAAAQEVGFRVPVVVRLEGTNVQQARQMLQKADIPGLIPADDLTDAARKVCSAAV